MATERYSRSELGEEVRDYLERNTVRFNHINELSNYLRYDNILDIVEDVNKRGYFRSGRTELDIKYFILDYLLEDTILNQLGEEYGSKYISSLSNKENVLIKYNVTDVQLSKLP